VTSEDDVRDLSQNSNAQVSRTGAPSQLAINSRALGQLLAAALPRVPTRGPWRSTDITAGWLTAHLARHVPGAVAMSAAPLDGTTGTTDRRRLRVTWNEAGERAGLPNNLFIKSTPLSAKNRCMVGPLDMAVNEVRFYKSAAAELGGAVPTARYAYAGMGARFLIVLDDVVADGGRTYAVADRCDIEHARGLIDFFAALHSRFWASPRFQRDLTWARTWSTRPGSAILNYFYKRGRRDALRLNHPASTPAVHAVAAALDDHADAYYKEFEAGPLTLLHGDSHLGNSFSWADGRSGMLDWQVVWQGPGLREVAYWMTTGLDVDMRRTQERDLLDRYLEGLRRGGVPEVPTSNAAFERYRLFSAEAWDSTAMLIAWPGLQAPQNAEAGWQRACAAVEDLDAASVVESLR
jgi:Ecdysteroid kinase-like family